MITLKSCPVCGSSQFAEFRVVASGNIIVEMIPGVMVEAIKICRYSACRDCNLIFQNPRLSEKELDLYYNTGYYRRTVNPPPEGMDKGEENRAKTDIEIINRYIGKVASHLDIGCGRGYLLDLVEAKFKIGVESDIDYVKAKGIKVYVEMDKIPQKKFDLVTAIHVLEHVSYPLDFLRKMVKFVNKEGYLVIEVPSWKTKGGPLGFPHLSHFETDVLKLMCMKVGLKVEHLEFTPHLLLICRLDR